MPAFIFLNGQSFHYSGVDWLEATVPGGSIFKLVRRDGEDIVIGFVNLGPGCLATFGEEGDGSAFLPGEELRTGG